MAMDKPKASLAGVEQETQVVKFSVSYRNQGELHSGGDVLAEN